MNHMLTSLYRKKWPYSVLQSKNCRVIKISLLGQVMGRILHPVLDEFTSWCAGEKNIPENQIVAKYAAH